MALWGATALGLLFGYNPAKRHTALDHLTLAEKLSRIDLVGFFLLSAGIALFLTGLNLGGGIYAWSSPAVLTTLIVGLVLLVVFGVYEWRFTSTGILHHDLFRGGKKRGRTFSICIGLIFIEGILLFAYVIFYPVMCVLSLDLRRMLKALTIQRISSLFETDPFLQSVRQLPYWIAAAAGTILYGAWSTKRKTIRAPTMVGYILLTAGMVGFATIQPDDNLATWFFAALAGLGFGAPLILIIVGVQLSTPHHLIATATAATTCSRAIATAVFTAIASAALDIRLEEYIPEYISAAALQAGLPTDSLGLFIAAITGHGPPPDFDNIPGASPAIIAAGSAALKQAYADGLRVVCIIAAPFGVVACIATFFLGDLSDVMDYAVDAPVEELHAKHRRGGTA
jgi:hypothetical protein